MLLARTRISRKIGNKNLHPRTLFAVAAYLSEEGAAQRLGCDIVPDMIRCVQDLVLQRCELEIGSDREMLDDVCRQLDGILECLREGKLQGSVTATGPLLVTVRHMCGEVSEFFPILYETGQMLSYRFTLK